MITEYQHGLLETVVGMTLGESGHTCCPSGPDGEAAPEELPTVIPDHEHEGVPFPLTELQQAFWVGRANVFEIGNVGIHLYEEFEVPGLDIPRLQCGWRRLIQRHGMLRTIVLQHGEQQILTKVPD